MQVNETTTESLAPVMLRIPDKNLTSFDKLLIKLKLKQACRDFTIKPSSLATCARISELILEINPVALNDNAMVVEVTHNLIIEHEDKVVRIIALAIHNRPGEPARWLTKFLQANMSIADMHVAVNIAMKQMDLMSFIQAIVTLKGANILTVASS